ncbi:MAG: NTP transferase domain-containing protein [Planctomycetaceae bacterium]
MGQTVAIVLAAGKGTRMNSELPKVLHPVCGQTMVEHVFDAVRGAGVEKIVCVIGHQSELMTASLSGHTDVEFALQTSQNGTGHAVQMAEPMLSDDDGPVLVLAGDTPLLKSASLVGLLDELHGAQASCVVGTAITEHNHGLGRIVRSSDGTFVAIVEEKDATDEQRLIQEINTGCYAFSTRDLFESLREVRPLNTQGEYYLTDCPRILNGQGRTVVAAARLNIQEAMGVNTREQLAQVERVMVAGG